MPNRKEFVGSHFMIHVPNLNVDRQLGMKSRILQGGASRGWDIDGPRKFKSLKHSHHGSGGDINDRKEVSSNDGERLGVQRKRKAAVAVEEEDNCVGVWQPSSAELPDCPSSNITSTQLLEQGKPLIYDWMSFQDGEVTGKMAKELLWKLWPAGSVSCQSDLNQDDSHRSTLMLHSRCWNW